MINYKQLQKMTFKQMLVYIYKLSWHYILVLYVYLYGIKRVKKNEANDIFFDKWENKLKLALKNPELYNTNLDKEFYEIEEAWKNNEIINRLEEKWKSRILLTNTPQGNVYMYYDPYKLAFCYNSDNYISNILLNAVTIKYVLTNNCLDLFIEEKYLKDYNNVFLYNLKKYNEVIDDKKPLITSDVFIKRNKNSITKKKDVKKEKEVDYFNNKYIYKGKFYNVNILKKHVLEPKVNASSNIARELENEEDTRLSYKKYKIELKNQTK